MIDPLNNIRTIDLGDEQIILDPLRLKFNDATLGKWMEDLGIWYDYYSSKTAKAEDAFANAELDAEALYDEHFLKAKSEGLSDKAAEAYARTQPDVKVLQKREITLKGAVKQMKEYLKALDKTHDMAQNRGYTIRKEMDKLSTDIFKSSSSSSFDLDAIIGKSSS